MKDPRLVQDYLRDILEAMDKAEDFIGDCKLFKIFPFGRLLFRLVNNITAPAQGLKSSNAKPAPADPGYSNTKPY